MVLHDNALAHAFRMGTLTKYMETRKREAGDDHYFAQPVAEAMDAFIDQWVEIDPPFANRLWHEYFNALYGWAIPMPA